MWAQASQKGPRRRRQTSGDMALASLYRRISVISAGATSVQVLTDHTAHVHAVSERYESLNYEPVENEIYLNEIKTPKLHSLIYRKSVNRWVVCFLIGVLTAVCGAGISISTGLLIEWKTRTLQTFFNKCVPKAQDCLFLPLIVWIGINCAFTAGSVFLVLFIAGTVSAGSGIPQIKCFLNGLRFPGLFSLKCLLAKTVGVVCSMVGGLSVGKEGPMVHTGACVAARISQGKTADGLRRAIDFHVFQYYRTDEELRDFVAAGAATGIAAAFGAPIGGVLFSLEEGASFWNQSLTWRIFFACMTGSFSVNFIMSAYNGQPGLLTWSGYFNFGSFTDTSYSFWDFVAFMLLGVIGGLAGALFNYLNYRLMMFRISYGNSRLHKMIEAMLIAAISAIVPYLFIVFYDDCKRYQSELVTKVPTQLFCPEGMYSAVTALFMQYPEDGVVSLYHQSPEAYSTVLLLFYTVIQFTLVFWTSGIAVSSGLIIPCLLIGAGWGRLASLGLSAMFPGSVGSNVGLYALIGSAAQLGGSSRMTISLCVILLESTGELSFGLPLMIVLMISKWVGGIFIDGIYDLMIELAEVPMLGFDPPHLSSQVPAEKVMAHPVNVVRMVEKVGTVYDMLTSNMHNAYPVVDRYDPDDDPLDSNRTDYGRLRGLILRMQLIVLLDNKAFSEDEEGTRVVGNKDLKLQRFRDEYPLYERVLQGVSLSTADRECWMDLRPFMNTAPYCVNVSATLRKMYQLFRGLGLRHIVVVNEDNMVVGVVTRKDIARYRAERRKGRFHLRELLVSEVPFVYIGGQY